MGEIRLLNEHIAHNASCGAGKQIQNCQNCYCRNTCAGGRVLDRPNIKSDLYLLLNDEDYFFFKVQNNVIVQVAKLETIYILRHS